MAVTRFSDVVVPGGASPQEQATAAPQLTTSGSFEDAGVQPSQSDLLVNAMGLYDKFAPDRAAADANRGEG